MQTIIYNGRYAVLYRGGYDREDRRGLDPYQRCRNPFQRDPKSEIAEGFLLHTSSLKEKSDLFFGYPGNDRDQYIDGHWKICFDTQGRLVLSDSNLKNPRQDQRNFKNGLDMGSMPLVLNYQQFQDPSAGEIQLHLKRSGFAKVAGTINRRMNKKRGSSLFFFNRIELHSS